MLKQKYYKEINSLKKDNKKPVSNQKEVLNSPAEVENFKKNLRKSMIISFGPTPNYYQEPPNKISTNINASVKRSRI